MNISVIRSLTDEPWEGDQSPLYFYTKCFGASLVCFGCVQEQCWQAWRFVWVVVCCQSLSECLSVCHCLCVRCRRLSGILRNEVYAKLCFFFLKETHKVKSSGWRVVSWGRGVTVRPPVMGKTHREKTAMSRIGALRLDKGINKQRRSESRWLTPGGETKHCSFSTYTNLEPKL